MVTSNECVKLPLLTLTLIAPVACELGTATDSEELEY